MGASSANKKDMFEVNSSDISVNRNIRSVKRLNPNDGIKIPQETQKEKNAKKLKELNENDDFEISNPEYHEYMFFSMKNGGEQKNNNLDVLLKNKKKKKQKQLYTFTKNEDTRRKNELAQILHIDYELDKPKYPYSIKQIQCDKPRTDNDYLIIEYNMNKDNEEDRNQDLENESENKDKINKKFVLTSRVVHTNHKNCKISNYVYTKQNGERYDYLDMNQDTDQIRKLKLKKDDDEEKKVMEKEENQERFNNKNKKGVFRCKKMI